MDCTLHNKQVQYTLYTVQCTVETINFHRTIITNWHVVAVDLDILSFIYLFYLLQSYKFLPFTYEF